MPLQTYDQYFRPPSKRGNALDTFMQLQEMKGRKEERSAAREEREDRAGEARIVATKGMALQDENQKRKRVEWKQEDSDRFKKMLGESLKGVETEKGIDEFIKSYLPAQEQLARRAVDDFGPDSEQAAQINNSILHVRNRLLPKGRQGPQDTREAEQALNMTRILKKQLLEKPEQTPEEKAELELGTYEGKKKIDQKYPEPDKPGDAEERKIRLEKAKVSLQTAKNAYQKSLKGDKLTNDDVLYFGERLTSLKKKRDDAGPPKEILGIKYGGGDELTKGEKQEMVVLDRLLHQAYPASKLGTQAPAPPPPQQGMGQPAPQQNMGQPPPQEGIALPPEILQGLVQGQPKGVRFPDGTVHKLMLDQNGQPVEVQ